MNELIQISQEFEKIEEESQLEMIVYFEKYSGDEFSTQVESGIIPKWKQFEKACNDIRELFIQAALKLANEKKYSSKELIVVISNEVLKVEPPNINHDLLIRLMCEVGDRENCFCVSTLEKLI